MNTPIKAKRLGYVRRRRNGLTLCENGQVNVAIGSMRLTLTGDKNDSKNLSTFNKAKIAAACIWGAALIANEIKKHI